MTPDRISGLFCVLALLAGCAGMSDTQQRAAIGTVGGGGWAPHSVQSVAMLGLARPPEPTQASSAGW
jgi:hypothetical protein